MTNEESEVTRIKPVIPTTWVPCFQNKESVTDIMSNPKDLEPIWRNTNPDGDRMARFRDPAKKMS
jgi:hypothetical protein